MIDDLIQGSRKLESLGVRAKRVQMKVFASPRPRSINFNNCRVAGWRSVITDGEQVTDLHPRAGPIRARRIDVEAPHAFLAVRFASNTL
ncbi:hypothetical protein FQN55_002645 [Onygenales sp. PD_40]|nr:hypothetical protein FQN55_002645 [Onygenales sp. PD_40]KAK2783092.1 hypothetical protein FQN52_000433 [Onygenales sp. PD_12]KAK2786118.1 hypothetical protein FQN53_006879 [Emmonsiellopsis sp. PD_33]KAK2804959.1 hypothetical protein FQN51_001052 [Onygenales sp. PD_10]